MKGERRMEKYDYRKLRARIVEVLGSNKKLAEAIGITETGLSLKLNNYNQFTMSNITKICKVLKISLRDIGTYFFTIEKGE